MSLRTPSARYSAARRSAGYKIARALTTVADVTLAAPGVEPAGLSPARHVAYEVADARPLRALFREADVVITRPTGPLVASWLVTRRRASSTTSVTRSRWTYSRRS